MQSYLPMLVILLFLGVMMFMSSRAQKKQREEKMKQLEKMQPGDEIITIGGMHGLLHEVDQDSNTFTLDCEGVFLVFEISAIRTINSVHATDKSS